VLAALLGGLAMTGAVTGTGGAVASPDGPATTTIPAVFPATITMNTSGAAIGGTNSHYIGLSSEPGTLNNGKFDDGPACQGAGVATSSSCESTGAAVR